jgi:hypothetical protein
MFHEVEMQRVCPWWHTRILMFALPVDFTKSFLIKGLMLAIIGILLECEYSKYGQE